MKKFFLFIAMLSLSFSANGGMYSWVDDHGNVFYSDNVPPTAAKHGHVELNRQGLRKKEVMSASQLAELAAIIEAREIEAREKAEKSKKEAIARIQDNQLLAVYSNRAELINVFNDKIQMSKSTNNVLEKRHKILSERLEKTEIKYEKMKNIQFKKILEGKINDMLDGLKVYQQAITENKVEQNKLEESFKMNLKRFDHLMERADKEESRAKKLKMQALLKLKEEEEESLLDRMRRKLKNSLALE